MIMGGLEERDMEKVPQASPSISQIFPGGVSGG